FPARPFFKVNELVCDLQQAAAIQLDALSALRGTLISCCRCRRLSRTIARSSPSALQKTASSPRNGSSVKVTGCPSRNSGLPSAIASLARSSLMISSGTRSEEHTSELQSRENLVCRLLLEKKNKKKKT